MNLITKEEVTAYFEGRRKSLRDFAWWEAGREYVGCGSSTLKGELDRLSQKQSEAYIQIDTKGKYTIPQ